MPSLEPIETLSDYGLWDKLSSIWKLWKDDQTELPESAQVIDTWLQEHDPRNSDWSEGDKATVQTLQETVGSLTGTTITRQG